MKLADRAWVMLLIPCCAATLAAALIVVSHDPREQIVTLERFARKLERAQRIHPGTEQVVKKLVAAAAGQKRDQLLGQRQSIAINRIDAVLDGDLHPVGAIGTVQPTLNGSRAD